MIYHFRMTPFGSDTYFSLPEWLDPHEEQVIEAYPILAGNEAGYTFQMSARESRMTDRARFQYKPLYQQQAMMPVFFDEKKPPEAVRSYVWPVLNKILYPQEGLWDRIPKELLTYFAMNMENGWGDFLKSELYCRYPEDFQQYQSYAPIPEAEAQTRFNRGLLL